MTFAVSSRRRIVAAFAGASLLSPAGYMLYHGYVRMYYDYYFFAQVKEHYIAPSLKQRLIDAVVLIGIFLALYAACRLLKYSFAVRAHPASDR
jgi:hypothetical protein